MIELIFDCDITMGIGGKDVDDGLALLHLLGSPQIRLRGATSTFGNSSVEEVHPCLVSMLQDFGKSDIPTPRGAPRPQESEDRATKQRESPAARFLAEAARNNPGRITVLATGSPTNLLGAYRIDPLLFANLKEIVLMGGIVEPLIINGRPMPELNFSSDPQAAFYTLYAGAPPPSHAAGKEGKSTGAENRCRITVINANICLQALLTRERFIAFLGELSEKQLSPRQSTARGEAALARYLRKKVLPWFTWIEREYGTGGFYAWDATAALYLTHPQYFEPRTVDLRSSLADLGTGLLRVEEPKDKRRRINLPASILDTENYWRALFDSWRRAAAILQA